MKKFEVNRITFEGNKVQLHINTRHAFEAAQIYWNYIEKNGLSKHLEDVRIVFKNNQKQTFTAYYHAFRQQYIYDEIGYDISEILCWCEMPIFNKA